MGWHWRPAVPLTYAHSAYDMMQNLADCMIATSLANSFRKRARRWVAEQHC